MKKRELIAWCLSLALILSGCSGQESGSTDKKLENGGSLSAASSDTPSVISSSDMFSDRDFKTDYDESKSAHIQLNGDTAFCSSDAVQISGSTVTIIDEGSYILTGTLNNGQVIVNSEDTDKIQLVLNGVSIHNETSAPIYILQADKVFITLPEGTENTLSNGGSFVAIDKNNIDGTIYSKEDLTINGSGSLTVTSPAGHGIVSNDDLAVTGGSFSVSAASHGLDANDAIKIANASMTISSGKDGIHAENSDDASLGYVYIESGSFDITAQGDGISAGSAMQIEGGSFNILTGGGSASAPEMQSTNTGGFKNQMSQSVLAGEEDSVSTKGIKAGAGFIINGGEFQIDAADDGIHSNASLTINGGSFTIATGDDGFHADETLTISEGVISIIESYEGLEGLSIDITGGKISIYADDDGLNAAGGVDQSGFGGRHGGDMFRTDTGSYISISGGSIYINARGDGIDSNGSLEVTGGDLILSGPTQGDTSILDYDSSGLILGGTFIGTGASQMAISFGTSSTQGVIMMNTGTQPAGTIITLTDANGNILLTRETDQQFNCVLLSHPDIVKGSSYTLRVGETSNEITMESLIYGGRGGMGGGNMGVGQGGMGGGRGGRIDADISGAPADPFFPNGMTMPENMMGGGPGGMDGTRPFRADGK